MSLLYQIGFRFESCPFLVPSRAKECLSALMEGGYVSLSQVGIDTSSSENGRSYQWSTFGSFEELSAFLDGLAIDSSVYINFEYGDFSDQVPAEDAMTSVVDSLNHVASLEHEKHDGGSLHIYGPIVLGVCEGEPAYDAEKNEYIVPAGLAMMFGGDGTLYDQDHYLELLAEHSSEFMALKQLIEKTLGSPSRLCAEVLG